MSVIPEIILHRVIVQGLRNIRQDPRVIDTLFKNLDQRTLQAMKDTILKQSINFTINYPRGELKTPTIALLLKTEQEAQTFLGDLMGAGHNYGMPDQELVADTLGSHGASESGLSGLPVEIVGGLKISALEYDPDNNVTTAYFLESQRAELADILFNLSPTGFGKLPIQTPVVPSCDVYVSSGSGAGQVHHILQIDSNSLDIEGQFSPQLDSSSVVDVRSVDTTKLAVGEPSRVYPAGAVNLLRKGANYDVQYQLSVIAGHQDEVLYLYSVLKAILFSQKIFMENQGLMALKISGSDYAPRTEYLPNEVFQRVMILRFTYPFSFLEELEDYPKSIEITLNPEDPETLETGVPIHIEIDFSDVTTI